MRKIGILMITVFLLTGCAQQVDLTEQQRDAVVNYAAYVTLQHDKDYEKRLIQSETPENPEDSTAVQGQDQIQQAGTADAATQDGVVQDTTVQDGAAQGIASDGETQDTAAQDTAAQDTATQETTQEATVQDIATILKLDGFLVTYEGFEYSNEYTDSSVENGYTMKSLDGSEFVVMKFKVENTTDETKLCDVLSSSPQFSISVNGATKVESFASVMNNDLAVLHNEIGAHESMEAVLLVEVSKEYENNVTSLALDISVNGQNSTILLQ